MTYSTAIQIKNLKEVGKYSVGDGLYVVIKKQGSKSWIYRYTVHGKQREMGLGPTDEVTLAEARDIASDNRRLIRNGIDPIAKRDQEMMRLRVETARTITFRECSLEFIESQRSAWSNQKHIKTWEGSLQKHVFPFIGDFPIKEVSKDLVVRVLKPIWNSRTETASRIRARIERIISYASAMGYRTGENPASWKGNLDHIFPHQTKVAPVSHLPAVPIDETPEIFKALNGNDTVLKALQFLILTASRTGQTIAAEWSEINLYEKTWIIPAERMKSRREHRVPLSTQALEILNSMSSRTQNRFIFPGRIGGRHISEMSFLMTMRRLGRSEVPHGFRSTFKDWASERTEYPNEVSEMALAHVVSNKVEAAYRRGDLFEKRRSIMQDWADFCSSHK